MDDGSGGRRGVLSRSNQSVLSAATKLAQLCLGGRGGSLPAEGFLPVAGLFTACWTVSLLASKKNLSESNSHLPCGPVVSRKGGPP